VTTLAVPSGNNGVTFASGETSNSIISGFTIANVSSGDSSIYCNNSSPTITSNALVNGGNGVYCNFSSPTVFSNIIANNSGTAIYMGGAQTTLIQGNIIKSNAAGIGMNAATSPTVFNNIIEYNRGDAISGGNQNDIDIIQNVIAYNSGNAVSFLVPSGTRGPVCINNTVVSNNAGFSISGYDGASEILNNIAVGPSALNITLFNSPSTPVIWNNDFYNAGGSPYSGVVSNLAGVNGNISAEPQFACGISGDFRLLPTSPAIDAGSNGAPFLSSTDIIGNARVMGSRIDLGAYEANPSAPVSPCMYVNCPANIVASAASGQTSTVVTFPAPTGTPAATITAVPPSGSSFPAGTNTVICTATYGTNTANCSFTVTVVVAPSLTNTLVTTNVPAGKPFSLAVSPQGSAPFTYQWYFENTAIQGATSNPLTIANAQEVNEGLYRVAVFNSAGSITNSVASVRVLPTLPTILTNPASLTLAATSTATFQVAASGSQPLGYQWFFNSNAISGATASQYSITNIQAGNMGGYQVLVTNGLGSATSTVATLTVTPVAPFFTLQPAALSQVSGGSNLTLTAQANGSQPISYQWQFNGSNISGATNTALSLTNLAATNAGAYVLVASSFAGTNSSSTGQVVVFQKPTVMAGLSNQVVDVSNTVVLSATVLGTQPLNYSWQFNGQPIAGTNSTLTLANIQSRQSGFYRLTVGNQYGGVSTGARVSVLGAPGTLRIWGDDSGGQANVPTNLGTVVAMAGGDYHSIGLHHDGTIAAWGYDGDGQTAVPTNVARYVTIASGAAHNLAVTDSGSVAAWGRNDAGQCNLPTSLTNGVVSVAAGDSHSLALLSTGTVAAWGDNTFGQINVPQGLTVVAAIAAGREHSLALGTNGTVVAWGYNANGQATVPKGLANVVAIAAGYLHSVALQANGTVTCWGDDSFGQTNVPATATNVVAIAAGDYHTVALRGDGTVVCWGSDSLGQLDFPSGLNNVVNVACGNYHSLALVAGPGTLVISMTGPQMILQWSGTGTLQYSLSATGPFTDLVGIPGTRYTNSNMSGPAKFFRLRQ
jgi:parallel beta-helix repeat protein